MAKRIKAGNKNEKQDHSSQAVNSIDQWIVILLILAVGILPLLVIFKQSIYVAPTITYDIVNTQLLFDLYAYYKWIILLLLSISAIVLLIIKIIFFGYEINRNYINIPLFVLAALTLLSGVTAEHLGISIIGTKERFEGAITYLCYFALFFVASNIRFNKKIGLYVTAALCIFTVTNVIIALFQFYGKDLYLHNQFIRSLIIPQGHPEQLIPRTIFNSTLGNPNYTSGIACALTAFFLVAALLAESLRKNVVYSFFSLLSFTMLLATLSTSGFLSLLAVTLVIAALICFKSNDHIKALAFAGIIILSFSLSFTVLHWHKPAVWNETLGFFKLTDLKKEVDFTQSKSSNEFILEKQVATSSSGRTYIWRKTAELIKERPILGYGHDTIGYYFPQGDPLRTRYLGNYELIDKPHNMYLEVAFGSGVIALFSLIALILLHFYHTARKILKSVKSGSEIYFPASLFAFWCAFLVQWLFNDSVIGSSTIFWTLFGISVSLNQEL